MQEPTERHLARRQKYFVFILQDILYHAYQHAHQLYPDRYPLPTETNYRKLFTAATQDISRSDNQNLADASQKLSAVMRELNQQYPGSQTLRRKMLALVMKFAGEALDDDDLDQIIEEAGPARNQARRPARKQGEHGDPPGSRAGTETRPYNGQPNENRRTPNQETSLRKQAQ